MVLGVYEDYEQFMVQTRAVELLIFLITLMHAISYFNCALIIMHQFNRSIYDIGCRQRMTIHISFLADRTNGRAIATLFRLSVRL